MTLPAPDGFGHARYVDRPERRPRRGLPLDVPLLAAVTSASVCCGAHAGGGEAGRGHPGGGAGRGVAVGAIRAIPTARASAAASVP